MLDSIHATTDWPVKQKWKTNCGMKSRHCRPLEKSSKGGCFYENDLNKNLKDCRYDLQN